VQHMCNANTHETYPVTQGQTRGFMASQSPTRPSYRQRLSAQDAERELRLHGRKLRRR